MNPTSPPPLNPLIHKLQSIFIPPHPIILWLPSNIINNALISLLILLHFLMNAVLNGQILQIQYFIISVLDASLVWRATGTWWFRETMWLSIYFYIVLGYAVCVWYLIFWFLYSWQFEVLFSVLQLWLARRCELLFIGFGFASGSQSHKQCQLICTIINSCIWNNIRYIKSTLLVFLRHPFGWCHNREHISKSNIQSC